MLKSTKMSHRGNRRLIVNHFLDKKFFPADLNFTSLMTIQGAFPRLKVILNETWKCIEETQIVWRFPDLIYFTGYGISLEYWVLDKEEISGLWMLQKLLTRLKVIIVQLERFYVSVGKDIAQILLSEIFFKFSYFYHWFSKTKILNWLCVY